MAVVAVPFILYLVRFCSSKSCTSTRTVKMMMTMMAGTVLYGARNRTKTYQIFMYTHTASLTNRCAGRSAASSSHDATTTTG